MEQVFAERSAGGLLNLPVVCIPPPIPPLLRYWTAVTSMPSRRPSSYRPPSLRPVLRLNDPNVRVEGSTADPTQEGTGAHVLSLDPWTHCTPRAQPPASTSPHSQPLSTPLLQRTDENGHSMCQGERGWLDWADVAWRVGLFCCVGEWCIQIFIALAFFFRTACQNGSILQDVYGWGAAQNTTGLVGTFIWMVIHPDALTHWHWVPV